MNIKVLASSSKGNCHIISDGFTKILLDAGIPINQIQIGVKFRLSEIYGAFITHSHQDHCKAAVDLAKAGIDVYAHESVFTATRASGHRCHAIESHCDSTGIIIPPIIIGTFKIVPFDCQHDVPNLGFYIRSTITGENLLYFTDSFYVKYKFSDLHYIMAECNYSSEAINENMASGRVPAAFKKRLVHSHMSIDNLIEMLRQNDLSSIKQIYLLHLSDRNSREEEFKSRIQKEVGCEVYVG